MMRQALQIIGWQALGLLVMVLVATFWQGGFSTASMAGALGVLVGGAIGMAGTSYLLVVLIKRRLQPARPASVLTLFGSWLLKVMLTIALLALAMRSKVLAPGAVMCGLAGSLVVYWWVVMRLQASQASQR